MGIENKDGLSRRELFCGFWRKISRAENTGTKNTPPPNAFEYQLTRRQLLRAAEVGGAFLLAEIVSYPIVDRLRIPVGNSGINKEIIKDYILDNPEKGVTLLGIISPIAEEGIFRALPNAVLDEIKPELKGEYVWEVAVPISAAFALSHGIRADAIPLPQFAGGLVFWKMVREGGYPSAVVAHSTHNTLLVVGVSTLAKVFGVNDLG